MNVFLLHLSGALATFTGLVSLCRTVYLFIKGDSVFRGVRVRTDSWRATVATPLFWLGLFHFSLLFFFAAHTGWWLQILGLLVIFFLTTDVAVTFTKKDKPS